MLEMIEDRKGSAVLEERRDLLSNLIRASMEKSEFEFTHRDLLGNIFIFLLAGELFASGTPDVPLSYGQGHETTASILSFITALLATHQEEQEELYKHIRSVVPDGRLPVRRGYCHGICSRCAIRHIMMFHNLHVFSRSLMRQCVFSPR